MPPEYEVEYDLTWKKKEKVKRRSLILFLTLTIGYYLLRKISRG